MATGKSNTTKIVLGITAGVFVLCLVCCGAVWFLIPKDKRALFGKGITMARQMAVGIQGVDKGFGDEFGEDARWELAGANEEAIFVLGVSGDTELDEETVADLQDRAWKRYTTAFAEGGMPLSSVAVGHAGERTGGSSSYQGKVTGWTKHVVDVATLVERTGIPEPPRIEFFESIQQLKREGSGVHVEVTPGDEEETPPDENDE